MLNRMMDPLTGLASITPVFSLSAAREWLDNQLPVPELKFRPEVGKISNEEWRRLRTQNETLPHAPIDVHREERFPSKEENISPEERERRVKMLKETAQAIREVVRAKTVGRPSTLVWKQVDDPAARMEALANLTAMMAPENQGTGE